MHEPMMIGLDQSTSGTKVVLVNQAGVITYQNTKSHKQYYPKPGWVEQDASEILDNCVTLLRELVNSNLEIMPMVHGVSITNQRETIVFWDTQTGAPLCPAIVWQCRRSSDLCAQLQKDGHGAMVKEKTGLNLDPYFSGSKILWAMQHVEAIQASAKTGTLRVGTVDAWLVYRLTAGNHHVTDHTNASRTLLYNLKEHDWDQQLMDLFQVTQAMLPKILDSDGDYGYLDDTICGYELPIRGVIGDSQGALFGQKCFTRGMAKATFGTGSSVMVYMGQEPKASNKGIMTAVAWGLSGQVHYAMEGIINSSGDTLKWVHDQLGLYEMPEAIEPLIASIESNEGVYLIPAFVGLGAPYWQPDAKAAIVGLSRKSGKAHIVRAAVESMAYQVADLLDLMATEAGTGIQVLQVDGGPTKNQFLMQLQADLLQMPVQTAFNEALSVLGAVFIGGMALGIWNNQKSLMDLNTYATVYQPKMTFIEAKQAMVDWRNAVRCVIGVDAFNEGR